MKAGWSLADEQPQQFLLGLIERVAARRVRRKMPRRASSSMLHTSSAGRRMVMATQPAVVAGGSTICTRSPVGRDAESSGEVASMRC